TRLLARGLIPVNVTGGGLITALRELALKSEEIFRIRCRLECPLRVRVSSPETATHLYRIAQESISNAVRHGKATEILIELRTKDNRLCLAITDNGAGIPQPLPRTEGMGLRIMQHRAGMIRATLDVRLRTEGGTKVKCTLSHPL
ncbi:MAG: histidine kinase, partial [Verrucomicrobiaceae bacterium]